MTTRKNQFTITFEVISNDRVRVFVDDVAQGYVRIHDVRSKGKTSLRLTYRDSSAPFKNMIRTPGYLDLATETVAELLTRGDVYRDVIVAVLRSYLYSTSIEDIVLRSPRLQEAA